MARGDGRIEFEFVTTGTDEATRDVQGLNRELGQSGQAANRAGAGVSSFGQRLATAGAVVAGVGAAIGAATAAAVAFGREMERQSGILSRFHGDISQARDATNGLVSDLQLMATANQLASRGIQASGRDLRNIVVAAFERARATGQEFNQTLDQLIEALSGGSVDSLQEFGLALTEGAERTDVIHEALGQLDERFGDIESSADSAGGRIDQFTTALENAETAFIETITQSSALEDAFTSLFSIVGGGSGDFERAMRVIVITARVMGETVNEILRGVTSRFSRIGQVLQALASGDFRRVGQLVQEDLQANLATAADVLSGDFMDRMVQRGIAGESAAEERRSGGGPARTTVTNPGRRRQQSRGPHRDPLMDSIIGDLDEAAIRRELDDRARRLAGLQVASAQAFFAELDRNRAESQRGVRNRGAMMGEDIEAFRQVGAATGQSGTEAFRQSLEDRQDAMRAHQLAMRDMEALGTDWTAEQFERRLSLYQETLSAQRAESRSAVEEIRSEAQSVLQPVMSGLTEALVSIVSGSKSADEAFRGLLASFLEMISQRAALEAAAQFAQAIAAFADLNAPKGAMHLLAGAAWTGVAVAAGAAAVAVAPAAAATPASPQQSAPEQQQGGGNLTLNVNGPIITAGDRKANRFLGRELGRLVDMGAQL